MLYNEIISVCREQRKSTMWQDVEFFNVGTHIHIYIHTRTHALQSHQWSSMA